MKKILITGCNGQLGRALSQVLAGNDEYELIKTDVEDLDITDIRSVMKTVCDTKPYAIVNCAAYTNVNGCETNKELAFKINVIGPRNLSIGASEAGAKLFHISTDYVFSGKEHRHYYEFDETDPQSAYGETKLQAEQMVRQFASKYFILRTAWMYGDGKNFVRTMLSIAEKNDTVQVVNDQFGTPTWSMDLARCIAYLLPTDNYGTFHATNEGECCWAEFAEEIFRLAGKKMNVIPVSTEEYNKLFPGQANRPEYSVLNNFMLDMTTSFKFPSWKESIEKYIKTLSD